MGKQIFKIIFLIIIIFGIGSGVYIATSRDKAEKLEIQHIEELFTSLQNKEVQVAKFYTYGDSLNVEGSLDNINKENLENVKLVVTDGENESTYDVDYTLENKLLIFKTKEINKGIELDKLGSGNYFVFLRIKFNNNIMQSITQCKIFLFIRILNITLLLKMEQIIK